MADEINSVCKLHVTNGSSEFVKTFDLTLDQAAVGGPTPGYLTIGTTEESEAFSELSTEGWLLMQNLDTTNYIEWGFSTGVYGGRMEAGEFALFRMNPSLTLYLKADTANCKALVYGFED